MKKLLIAVLLAVTVATSAFADTKKVNILIKNTFNADYPGATNITWTIGSNFAKATFVVDKQKMEAFYQINGDKIGTSKSIDPEDLPVSAKRTLAKKYSEFIAFGSFSVKEAIRFDRADEGAYFISLENEHESVILKVTDSGVVTLFDRAEK
ncbi:MAG: hypothetical protein JWQ40_662 [Segetibacter sp.]|nr:hypothetical protein [Segetibacter sp.]